MTISEFITSLHGTGIEHIVKSGGVPVMALILFVETGLLVGFVLPGDTMLFLAGVCAGTHLFNYWYLTIALTIAAIAGDQMGYFLGYECGAAIFAKKDGRFFKKAHATKAHDFYMKNGTFAVILARFIPVLRTFVPFMAGVGQMNYWWFLLVDSFGGAFWIFSIVTVGYVLGHRAENHIWIILPIISLVSFIPLIIGIVKELFFKKHLPATECATDDKKL